MTLSEATTQWQNGSNILIVEYRSSTAEVITYRDKSTGRMEKMNRLTHNCELGNISLPVSERIPDGSVLEPATYKAPYQKGQRCLLTFESILKEKGAYKVNGRLEPLHQNGEVNKKSA